jgi:hypothetical protein
MKKGLLVLLCVFALLEAKAQNSSWVYDFGTASAAPYTSTTYSSVYLPAPVTGGGNSGVRASSATEGSVELTTAGIAGGTGSELKMTSGTTATGAKFGLAPFAGTTVATFQCKINISSGTNGRFLLYFGNGSNFTGGSGISVPQTFAALRLSPTSTAVGLDWLSSSTSPNYTTTGLSQTTISKNQAYTLKFFMNNSNSVASYITGSGATLTTYNLAAGTFDIWIDNVKVLTNADPGTGLLPQGTVINGINLVNLVAGSSAPVMYIDDISYTNFLIATPPVIVPPPVVTNTILNVDYETGTLNSGITGLGVTNATAADAAYMVSPGATGNYAIAHKMVYGDSTYVSDGSYRSESDAVDIKSARYFPGDERRYEFSVLLKDWTPWVTDPTKETNIFQLKVSGNSTSGSGVPLQLRTTRNAMRLRYEGSSSIKDIILDLQPLVNQWLQFRIDVLWKDDATGYMRTYMKLPGESNYTLVDEKTNYRTFAGDVSVGNIGYIKWGGYILPEGFTRIIYHDDIRIFELNNTSNPVALWDNPITDNNPAYLPSPYSPANDVLATNVVSNSTSPSSDFSRSTLTPAGNATLSGRYLLGGWATGSTGIPSPFDDTEYYEFKIAPQPGYKLNLKNMTFYWRTGGATNPNTYVLRSSLDNFTSNISAPVTVSDDAANTSNFGNSSIYDLANISTTSEITFRMYWYGAATAGTLVGIDNFAFNGNVYEVESSLQMTAKNNVTKNTDNAVCTYTAQGNEFDTTATGNCGSIAYSYVLSGATTTSGTGSLANKVFNKGTTTVSWIAVDQCDSVTKTFNVTVKDEEKPLITIPTNISMNNDAGQCGVTATLSNPIVSDNCGIASIVSNAPAIFPVGVTTVTWTVKDVNDNTNTTTQTVTVTDNELPTITATTAINTINDAGQCGATVVLETPNTSDNCGVASIRNDAPVSFPLGTTTIIWTVKDVNGNTNTATQTVTVTDAEAPTVSSTASVALCHEASSNYNIPAATATDNCNIGNITYQITGATTRNGNGLDASGNFNVGTSTITWTVTDNAGNSSTTATAVTINSEVSANIADVYAVSPGGKANTIYLGYGPSSLTLTATPANGTAPYTYLWSNGATTASIMVNPSLAGVDSYTATITDALGCSVTVTKQITVTDILCADGKVKICHSSNPNHDKSLCISTSGVSDHLAHGCYLGSCSTLSSRGITAIAKEEANEFMVIVAPNPSKTEFQINVTGDPVETVFVRVFDISGRRISLLKANAGQTITTGGELIAGIYLAEITQGKNTKTVKLIKQ